MRVYPQAGEGNPPTPSSSGAQVLTVRLAGKLCGLPAPVIWSVRGPQPLAHIPLVPPERSQSAVASHSISRFSVSSPASRQDLSKLAVTCSSAGRRAGETTRLADVLLLLTGLLASFGFDTQSLSAQGGQRRPYIFNRDRDNPMPNGGGPLPRGRWPLPAANFTAMCRPCAYSKPS